MSEYRTKKESANILKTKQMSRKTKKTGLEEIVKWETRTITECMRIDIELLESVHVNNLKWNQNMQHFSNRIHLPYSSYHQPSLYNLGK